MNSTTMPDETEKQRGFNKKTIITVGIIAAITILGTLSYLIYKRGSEGEHKLLLPPDPPPIIVRTGSFILGSDIILDPDNTSDLTLKRGFTGGIQQITIIPSKEKEAPIDSVHLYAGGTTGWGINHRIEVIFYVQYCLNIVNNTCGANDYEMEQRIRIFDSQNEFLLTTPLNFLSGPMEKGKFIRRFKYEDVKPKVLKINRIVITNLSTSGIISNFTPIENQDYIIGFYNTLPPSSTPTP